MKRQILFSLCILFMFSSIATAQTVDLLEDGKLDHWVTAQGKSVTTGWSFEDGVLKCEGGGSGLLLTKETYRDFELVWQWKITAAGNSGIKYRVRNYGNSTLGCEYQMLDDPQDKYGKHSKNATGSLYAIWEPTGEFVQNPAEQWNESRIVVKGQHVRHFLNGVLVVDGRIGSRDWQKRVAESKFSEHRNFSENRSGLIMLTEHGNPTWFRSMTIKKLGLTQRLNRFKAN